MRRVTPLVGAAILLALLCPAAHAGEQLGQHPPIPTTLDSAAWGAPPWLAAEVLVTEAGAVDLEMIANLPSGMDENLDYIVREAGQSTAPCVEVGTIFRALPAGLVVPKTVEELASGAYAVLRGTVVASAGGFYDGMPGLLLQVRVDERLKRSAEFWTGPYVYVYYPVGEFSLGPIRVCKTDHRWPAPPAIGSSVVLFPHRIARDDDRVLMRTMPVPFEIVLEDDGELFGPSWLAGPGTIDGLVEQVRASLAGRAEGGAR